VVGDSGDIRNDAAKNEKQIISGFESKQDVITKIKYQFEELHEWVIETLCRMAYGDKFLDCEVDYGSQFYLTDEYALLDSLSVAKDKRVPDAVISDLTRQYFETKYRADSETKKRMRIVLDLDPYPSKSIEDVYAIYATSPQLIGDENMQIKLNLDSLLQRFERENVPLTQFGNQYEYYQKIDIINKTIRGYAKTNSVDSGQQEQPVSDQGE
jgi:lipopolysaccharide export system protein LptA